MSYLKFLIFWLIIYLISFDSEVTYSQSDSPEWFPEKCIFPFIEYDLLEVIPYTGVFALKANNVDYEGVYIPVNIGFRKSFIQWKMLNIKFDLSFGVASYTQFEIIKFDENTLRGGLINTDFKVSGFLSTTKENHKFRLQVFHVSSHLGDDYLIRNQVFVGNDKSVNYEQVDLIYLFSFARSDIYIGVGEVFSPNAYRKRFMLECGFQASIPLKPKLEVTFGSDVKLYDENDFNPNIHSAAGISLRQREHVQMNFSIDSFYGSLPYSTLDFGIVYWLGLSSKLYL